MHEVAQRLAPDCVPVFSSDGLALYFPKGFDGAFWDLDSKRGWASPHLDGRSTLAVGVYAQVIKKYRRKRITEVDYRVHLGTPAMYREAVRAAGFTGQIQTAFIERLNPLRASGD